MLTTIANVLAGLVGAGIIFVGLQEIWLPKNSAGFGIPNTRTDDPTFQAWLSVKAVRDIASGVFTFILLVGAPHHLMGWFMLAAAGIPVGDMLIVLRNKGPKATAFGVHGATAAVMLVSSVLLLTA
jgi:hypothetical protein